MAGFYSYGCDFNVLNFLGLPGSQVWSVKLCWSSKGWGIWGENHPHDSESMMTATKKTRDSESWHPSMLIPPTPPTNWVN